MQITLTTKLVNGGSCAVVNLDGKPIGEYWRIGEVIQYGMGDKDECYVTDKPCTALVHILMEAGVISDQLEDI